MNIDWFLKMNPRDKLSIVNQVLFGVVMLSLAPNAVKLLWWQLGIGLTIFFGLPFPIFVFIFIDNIFYLFERIRFIKWLNIIMFIAINMSIIQLLLLAINLK